MAKAIKSQQSKEEPIDIVELKTGEIVFNVLGVTPLICNRLSEKARHELLLPRGRKNAAEKASTLKHNPYEEFRASPYKISDESSPTLIAMPGSAFKQAGASAAKDIPGAAKAQIGRLTWVNAWNVAVFGVPQIFCSIVRSADMNRTPDVRTRAILPRWACQISIRFVKPILNEKSLANLVAAGGVICGVGDWRQEKGSANFGQFKLVGMDDPEFAEIVKTGGRKAQIEAMKAPEAFDDETADLLDWFSMETGRRGVKVETTA